MKKILPTLLFLLAQLSFAAPKAIGLFSPFNTSNRCRELLGKRSKKMEFIGKLEGLKQRNRKLLATYEKKQRILSQEKLKRNYKRIERELTVAEMGLKNMEEDIIRKGCPGIKL